MTLMTGIYFFLPLARLTLVIRQNTNQGGTHEGKTSAVNRREKVGKGNDQGEVLPGIPRLPSPINHTGRGARRVPRPNNRSCFMVALETLLRYQHPRVVA